MPLSDPKNGWREGLQHRNPGGPLLLQSDGRWIHVSERKTQDGGTVGVFTDVTELKRAEEALREKTEFLALNQVITAAANEAAGVEAQFRSPSIKSALKLAGRSDTPICSSARSW